MVWREGRKRPSPCEAPYCGRVSEHVGLGGIHRRERSRNPSPHGAVPMPMQIRTTLACLTMVCFSGCAVTEPGLSYAAPGTTDCAGAIAAKGLRVYVLADEGWDEFRFDGSAIRQSTAAAATGRRIERNDPDISEDIEKRFPEAPRRLSSGEKLGFPAARSPDGQKWAAGILTTDRMSPTELLIKNGGAFHRVGAISKFRIETLAWSPRSDQIAVIAQNYDNRSRTFKDLISPHGVSYSDIVLRLFRPSGELICQTLIAKKRRTPQPLIEWLAE